MTLMKSKPRWHKGEVIATERGWVNPQNNEVLVAIGNLKVRLEEEGIFLDAEEVTNEMLAAKTVKPEPVVPRMRKAYAPRKPKEPTSDKKETAVEKTEDKKEIIGEVTEAPAGKVIIAEVVEDDLTKKVIAE